jgi:hypothetical protein
VNAARHPSVEALHALDADAPPTRRQFSLIASHVTPSTDAAARPVRRQFSPFNRVNLIPAKEEYAEYQVPRLVPRNRCIPYGELTECAEHQSDREEAAAEEARVLF